MVSDLAETLETFLERTGAPAVTAALLAADEVPVMGVCGIRVRGGRDVATLDDFWHIGSCAKSITSALAARFVESGRLTWETTLSDLFPDLAVHRGWEEVTLAQVFHNRSGLRANLNRAEGRVALADLRPVTEQRTELAERLLAVPSDTVGRFRYSNLGYTLAGGALERLGGRPYERLVFDELLEPLGITAGGFGPPAGPHPWGHRGRLGGLGKGPAVAPGDSDWPHPADNPPLITPAGRLHLRLGDWAKFIQVFLQPNPGFFTDETINALITPTTGRGANQAMGWGEAKAPGVSIGQQGSNRRWVATALLSDDRARAALVATNDGRSQMIRHTAMLAMELLCNEGSQV